MATYFADFLNRLRADKVLDTKQPTTPHAASMATTSPKKSKMVSSAIFEPPYIFRDKKLKNTDQDLAGVEYGVSQNRQPGNHRQQSVDPWLCVLAFQQVCLFTILRVYKQSNKTLLSQRIPKASLSFS